METHNQCQKCERTVAQLLEAGSSLYHLCDDGGPGYCPERDDAECFDYLCSDCAEDAHARAAERAPGPSSAERHQSVWLAREALRGGR